MNFFYFKKINKGFTPTPILKRMSGILTYFNFPSLFSYQTKRPVGIGVSLHDKRGFTLVELLVTISMFVIITGVVLVNSNKFDSTVLLNNFAYDVALTIRQAQSYGVNVKENANISDPTKAFGLGYGVYFDVSVNDRRTNFVLFQDVGNGSGGNPDKIYNNIDSVKSCPTSNTECIQKFSMTKGTFIQSICAGTNEADCNNNPANQLSILFQRPSLKANIYINNIYTGNDFSDLKQYAKIVLAAANGATSTVVVTSIGQIYVRK